MTRAALRTSKTSLSIIERAYRGSLEEQYGHIVWLTQIMKAMGAPTSILLKGDTVLYAKRQQPRSRLRLGDIDIAALSHYESSIEQLLALQVPVYAWQGDLERLALNPADLVSGVQRLDPAGLIGLIRRLDCVWYW
jgi:sulfur relay (sulfurtransferase) DsrF/TusC family protein